MHFDLSVNGQPITKFSVQRQSESFENGEGWYLYDWTGWRPDPELPPSMSRYATASLVHRDDDGIEELAAKVIAAYQKALS